MRVVAIDPGTLESALLVFDGTVREHGFISNSEVRKRLKENNFGGADLVAIEMIQSFGMPVGNEVFETIRWVGVFCECAIPPCELVFRKDIKIHLCGSMRAKDANIRQALIDKLGPQGTKKAPGPTYGVSKHAWAALAVAVFARETLCNS